MRGHLRCELNRRLLPLNLQVNFLAFFGLEIGGHPINDFHVYLQFLNISYLENKISSLNQNIEKKDANIKIFVLRKMFCKILL